MSHIDKCEDDDSWQTPTMSDSYNRRETTRMLLRDFLCKAKATRDKTSDDNDQKPETEIPSPFENVQKSEITSEISCQASVIKSVDVALEQIKESSNNEQSTQMTPWYESVEHMHNDNVFESKHFDLVSKTNEEGLHNHLSAYDTKPKEENCFSRSKLIDFGWNLNEAYNRTRSIYENKQTQDEDSLTESNLGLSNKQISAYDNSINFRNYNSISSDAQSSTDSFISTSPKSSIETHNTPRNIMDVLSKKSRFLKKAWLDRHTEEDSDNSSSTESQYTSSSKAKRVNLKQEIKLYDTDDRKGIFQYRDGNIRKKFNTKFKNSRNLLARSQMEFKAKNRNIITLDETAVNILAQAKNTYNNMLNHRPMSDTCKNDKAAKVFDNDEFLEEDCSDNNEFKELSFHKNLNKKELKKFEHTFLQDGPCFQVAPKLSKCRECRWTQNQDLEDINNICCRFYSFRKLRYTKNLMLATAGFSDPYEDPSKDDKQLWLPNKEDLTVNLDIETSHFILKHVGDQFCDLVEQERNATALSQSENGIVAWKKLVRGVREMCDVCETTLFNVHWTCGKCGFIVCLDCYRHRINDTGRVIDDLDRDLDEFSWLLCTNRTSHEPSKLMLTQIIPGDSLILLRNHMYKIRSSWNLQKCCAKSVDQCMLPNPVNNDLKEIIKENSMNTNQDCTYDEECSDTSTTDSEMDDSSICSFRDMLLGPQSTIKMPKDAPTKKMKKKQSKLEIVNDIISIVLDKKTNAQVGNTPSPLKSFTHRHGGKTKLKDVVPTRTMTMIQSSTLYPDIPHTWLCDGKLLCLLEANHIGNYQIFQDQWKTGQPIMVANVSNLLDMNLWHPDRFAADFGVETNDLINCMTGKILPNQPMAKFWEGFEHFSKRLKDDDGLPMLLKLKDWPPGEDFAEVLPTRFQDLMQALPLGEYTKRDGKLNLPSCLPDCFVKPDLGPKMYNAYGSALHPTKGTTNLHMDISDAVNIMVYVGIPEDGVDDDHIKEALRAIDEAGCDILTRRRARLPGKLPGALWHIYTAGDADKIRDLLNKVSLENGNRLEPHHDPIHDQSWYLDGYLRERLYKEYGVEGYAIVQCRGDAIFIPAGAPHQVRNLHNCVKVAEDFVSPENVTNCFHLTQEFRELSDTHTNHEDKLQIKNIIYHAVKEAVASMSRYLKEDLD